MSSRNRGSQLGAKGDVRFPRHDGPANSAVTTYILTPAELAELNEKLKPKPIPDWETKPINLPTQEKREAYHMSKLTKEQYLTKRHEGMTQEQIATDAGLKPQNFSFLLNRWGIKNAADEVVALREFFGVKLHGAPPLELNRFYKEEDAGDEKVIESADLKQTGVIEEAESAQETVGEAETAKQAESCQPEQETQHEPILALSHPIERSVTLNVTITERIILESLRAMQEAVHDTAVSKGWYDPAPTFPTQIALIHSELSEAMEADRKRHGSEKVAEELADVVIRVMDTAQSCGLDLAQAIMEKNERNRAREHRHGGLAY